MTGFCAWDTPKKIEIILQFFTGSMDISETYCDDIQVVAIQYLSSFGGFWFDFATSLPWAFNDLYAYQVFNRPLCGVPVHFVLLPHVSTLFSPNHLKAFSQTKAHTLDAQPIKRNCQPFCFAHHVQLALSDSLLPRTGSS